MTDENNQRFNFAKLPLALKAFLDTDIPHTLNCRCQIIPLPDNQFMKSRRSGVTTFNESYQKFKENFYPKLTENVSIAVAPSFINDSSLQVDIKAEKYKAAEKRFQLTGETMVYDLGEVILIRAMGKGPNNEPIEITLERKFPDCK